jgi:hypothetical protein
MKALMNSSETLSNSSLKELLTNFLYSKLITIYDQIRREGNIEIFGDLDFKVVEKIDGKKERIAKLDGKKILVKLNALALPESALKYIIAHEIAHTFTKEHTRRFWKIVETIDPNFEIGKKYLMGQAQVIIDDLGEPMEVDRGHNEEYGRNRESFKLMK